MAKTLGASGNFELLKPTPKTNATAACGAPGRILEEFLEVSALINITRPVKGRLRIVESGLNRYIGFCRLVSPPPLPVATPTARR